MPTYGVTPQGFSRKRLPEILGDIETDMKTVFGNGVVLSPQSPLGQLNGLFSSLTAFAWELAEDAYQSYDPDQAEGIRLDQLGRIRLIARALGEADDSYRDAITNSGIARVDLADNRGDRASTIVVQWHEVADVIALR
jgi:hypothetical protein